MLKYKFWHNKKEIKNVKGVKMVEFLRACDQYLYEFNSGHFFNSPIVSPF